MARYFLKIIKRLLPWIAEIYFTILQSSILPILLFANAGKFKPRAVNEARKYFEMDFEQDGRIS